MGMRMEPTVKGCGSILSLILWIRIVSSRVRRPPRMEGERGKWDGVSPKTEGPLRIPYPESLRRGVSYLLVEKAWSSRSTIVVRTKCG